MHRDALRHGFHLSPGPLADALSKHVATAERAAAGLWRHDPAAWSSDPAVQKTIANRPGWIGSPALMAGSIGRIRTFASLETAGRRAIHIQLPSPDVAVLTDALGTLERCA